MHPLSTDGLLPVLETPRFLLRQPGERDAPALFRIFGDPETMRYWSSPPLEEPARALDLVREIGALAERGTLFQWGVAPRESPDEMVGTLTLAGVDPAHRRASIGFAVARAHWGRGIAGEVAERGVRHGFEALGLHRLCGDVDPRNTASVRIFERLGFRPEGHLRQHYWQSDEWQDALLFGLLRDEWEGAGR